MRGDCFLVVEDDQRDAREVVRHLENAERRVVLASCVADVRALRRELGMFAGAIVDLGLPDGSGVEVVHYLRGHAPGLPVLVITATHSPEVASVCQLLGVELVYKPAERANLRTFADRTSWSKRMDDEHLARHLSTYAARHGLTAREEDVLRHAMQGHGRRHIAELLGRSESGVKSRIRSLLKKTGKRSLAAVVQHILGSAWVGPARTGQLPGEEESSRISARSSSTRCTASSRSS